MSEHHVHYITEPLKGLIFTLSAYSDLPNIFIIKSATDKTFYGYLETSFMYRNTTSWMVQSKKNMCS